MRNRWIRAAALGLSWTATFSPLGAVQCSWDTIDGGVVLVYCKASGCVMTRYDSNGKPVRSIELNGTEGWC